MNKEAPVGTETGVERQEIRDDIYKLMGRFIGSIDAELGVLRSPSKRSSWRDLLNTQVARDRAIMSGKGIPPIALFQRGGFIFELINYEVSPEIKTLALSVKDGKNLQKLVALSVEEEQGGDVLAGYGPNGEVLADNELTVDYGNITYIEKLNGVVSKRFVNNAEAIKGAKIMLQKLEHPFLSSLSSSVFEKAA